MGQITELVLDGVLCQVCGVAMDEEVPGFPRSCPDCVEVNHGQSKDNRALLQQDDAGA